MDALKQHVCVCCNVRGHLSMYPEIHHLLSGNRRRGHMFTVALCEWHHRGVPFHETSAAECQDRYGPSLANGSKPFHAAFFGSDDAMLEYQNKLLGDW